MLVRTLALAIATMAVGQPSRAMENHMPGKDPVVSAEVVFAPASGASLENAVITAENVKSFAPAPDAVDAAKRYFTQAGFQTSGLNGISFTISGPRSVFEHAFATKIGPDAKGAAKKGQSQQGGGELPLTQLPAPVRRGIKAITFSRPLDYGPGGSFSQ
jgi:hypothetical protein